MTELNTWEQKKKLHAMIRDISRQVMFFGRYLDEAECKLLIYAGHYGQDVQPNPFFDASNPLTPQFVIRNRVRTNDLDKSGDGQMSDLITQLLAFGNEKGVNWTDPEWRALIAERKAA